MNYWLMKNEPEAFSIDDLKRRRQARWDGIRNYQVRNMLRDEVAVGDRAVFYHSNAGRETGAVGTMEVIKAAYPDPLQFDVTSEYYDAKSPVESPRWLAVEVGFIEKYKELVPLAVMRGHVALKGMKILERGNRLSVTKLTKKEFDTLSALGTQEKGKGLATKVG